MSAADDAYAAAVAAIREAARSGGDLSLQDDRFRALAKLPPEIADLTRVQFLSLIQTEVTDIGLLRGLTSLQGLWLIGSPVADISPLGGLTKLQTLVIDDTRIADLGPLQSLTELHTLELGGTLVTDLTPLQSLINLRELLFSGTEVADLAPLQNLGELEVLEFKGTLVASLAPLAGSATLHHLRLDGTRVSDLTSLQTLTALRTLTLDNTQFTDLAPLQNLTALRALSLNDTRVADLRSIARHSELIEGARFHPSSFGGLHYKGCEACILDPDGLGKLAEIEDTQERTRRTLDYLQRLTVWPPHAARSNPDPGPEIPEQDKALRVAPNPDAGGRLDVQPGTPAAEEAGERLKQRLYARLKTTLDALATATGNQHCAITRRVRHLRDGLPDNLAEADLLAVYLDLDWLRGIHERRGERHGDDRLPTAAIEALHEIGTLGPGLVLGNAEVELLEERRRSFALGPNDPAAEAAQDALSDAIATNDALFAPTLRRYAGKTVGDSADPGSRLRVAQRILNRNVLIAVGRYVVDRSVGGVIGAGAFAGICWAVANTETILAAATVYGGPYGAWLRIVLGQAAEIAAAVESTGLGARARGELPARRD